MEAISEKDARIKELSQRAEGLSAELSCSNTEVRSLEDRTLKRELSQASEEALEDLWGSQEQYSQEMEAIIEEKDAKIKELSQRAEDLSAVSCFNTEL